MAEAIMVWSMADGNTDSGNTRVIIYDAEDDDGMMSVMNVKCYDDDKVGWQGRESCIDEMLHH